MRRPSPGFQKMKKHRREIDTILIGDLLKKEWERIENKVPPIVNYLSKVASYCQLLTIGKKCKKLEYDSWLLCTEVGLLRNWGEWDKWECATPMISLEGVLHMLVLWLGISWANLILFCCFLFLHFFPFFVLYFKPNFFFFFLKN